MTHRDPDLRPARVDPKGMTGPEHYKEAERLVGPRTAHRIPSGDAYQAPPTTDMILQAQVHATLALAAAVGLSRNGEMPVSDSDAWMAATSGEAATDG